MVGRRRAPSTGAPYRSAIMRIFQHAILALSLSVATTVAAQPASTKHTDFTGTWQLDPARSEFGGMPAIDLTATIAQNDTAFTFTQAAGGQSATQVFPLKAGASTWNAPGGQPVTTTPVWEAGTLVITTKASRGGVDLTQVNRWSLSPDGKTMTMQQDAATPNGSLSLKLVFARKS